MRIPSFPSMHEALCFVLLIGSPHKLAPSTCWIRYKKVKVPFVHHHKKKCRRARVLLSAAQRCSQGMKLTVLNIVPGVSALVKSDAVWTNDADRRMKGELRVPTICIVSASEVHLLGLLSSVFLLGTISSQSSSLCLILG